SSSRSRSARYTWVPVCSDDPPRSESPTLSLHDALPICRRFSGRRCGAYRRPCPVDNALRCPPYGTWKLRRWQSGQEGPAGCRPRSEEHTSELQSRENLVCRLLLDKKNHIPDADNAKYKI